MGEQTILERLKGVVYPNLEKNIVDLKCIDKVEISGKTLSIWLEISNNEAFSKIANEISKLFKKEFKDIQISKKSPSAKKEITYGHTAAPNNRAPYAKKVIALTSGKGGVGKSAVCANLAVAFAQKGYKVGLLDADVYGPSIPRILGVEGEKLRWGEGNNQNKIIPSENFGVKIMSVGLTTPRADTPLVWRSSVAVSALIQLLEDVDWGELDFLFIDMPPGTGDVQLTMAQELPIAAAVLVTTPQMVATDDVSRAIMMFKETGVKIGGIVENMSFFIAPDTKNRYDIFGNGGAKTLSNRYGVPFLGQIPLLIESRIACDVGRPIVVFGEEEQKNYYKNIADALLDGGLV